MKRTRYSKCIIFVIISVLLCGSISFTSLAATSAGQENSSAEKVVIPLKMVNFEGRKVDVGYEYTCDLVQETQSSSDTVSPQAIGWIKVGNASFRLILSPDNGIGYADWKFTLTNADFIKGVSGKFYVKKDLFGLYNPVLAEATVSEWYSYGTLYKLAQGSESFKFPGDVSYNQNVIFQWRNFYITGVTGNYSVTNGESQGKVSDYK